MTDFGSGQFTTWDGDPVSRQPPYGVTIVVASRAPQVWRYLLLHRFHHGGAAREGDWAWTPPTGSRRPGEDVMQCAVRELGEETGLDARPQPVRIGRIDWAIYALEIGWGTPIAVDGAPNHAARPTPPSDPEPT